MNSTRLWIFINKKRILCHRWQKQEKNCRLSSVYSLLHAFETDDEKDCLDPCVSNTDCLPSAFLLILFVDKNRSFCLIVSLNHTSFNQFFLFALLSEKEQFFGLLFREKAILLFLLLRLNLTHFFAFFPSLLSTDEEKVLSGPLVDLLHTCLPSTHNVPLSHTFSWTSFSCLSSPSKCECMSCIER